MGERIVSDLMAGEGVGLSSLLMSDEDMEEHPEAHLQQYVSSLMDCFRKNDSLVAAEREMEALASQIMDCAEAIAVSDMRQAYDRVTALREASSPTGTAKQRMGHHFAEALVVRITGTGSMLAKALTACLQYSIDDFYKAYTRAAESTPHSGMPVFFTNQTILDQVGTAAQVHIVDFGIGHGFRWFCLLKDFSERPGGPPHLRITGVEFPEHYLFVSGGEVGARLRSYAQQIGVSFEFRSVVSSEWDKIAASELDVRPDEFFVVTSFYRLEKLLDEPSEVDSPRKRLLASVHGMKPKLVIISVIPASCNSPSFLARVRGAVGFYTGSFWSLEQSFLGKDAPERRMIESICGLELIRMVACEGQDRTERFESYKQWQVLLQRAGFKQLSLRSHLLAKASEMVRTYHESFSDERHGNWLLIRWRKHLVSAISAWTTL